MPDSVTPTQNPGARKPGTPAQDMAGDTDARGPCANTDPAFVSSRRSADTDAFVSMLGSIAKKADATLAQLGPDFVRTANKDSAFASFRHRCISWLHQISGAMQVDNCAVASAVSIMDRYLALNFGCSQADAKLTCVASMLIAAKLCGSKDTNHAVHVRVCCSFSHCQYDKHRILQRELDMLSALGWEVRIVSAYEVVHIVVTHTDRLPDEVPLVAHWTMALATSIVDTARSAPSMLSFSQVVIGIAAVRAALVQADDAEEKIAQLDEITRRSNISRSCVDSCCTELQLLRQRHCVASPAREVTQAQRHSPSGIAEFELAGGHGRGVKRRMQASAADHRGEEDMQHGRSSLPPLLDRVTGVSGDGSAQRSRGCRRRIHEEGEGYSSGSEPERAPNPVSAALLSCGDED